MKSLLLSDRSPCLRYLVLTELLGRGVEDREVQELSGLRLSDPLVRNLLQLQRPDGSWVAGDSAWRSSRGPLLMTSFALFRLGSLGFTSDFEPLQRGAEYLFSHQRKDGGWSFPGTDTDDEGEGLTMSPIQTAFPLRGLARSGFWNDARSERGYEWLMQWRLDDGAWPTGYANDNLRRVAGYRRIAHSEWGCRTSTTMVLQCLADHPERAVGEEARRALDLLLGRETREAHTIGLETARMLGADTVNGFITFFARFDLSLLLDLAGRVGASREDPRIDDAVRFIESLRGPYGLWEYPQCSRWVSYGLLRTLSALDEDTDWIGVEPRTAFQAYPKQPSRF
ncbi:MAG: hypothetical protein AAF525_05040 [Pseudomonadota bacterium]